MDISMTLYNLFSNLISYQIEWVRKLISGNDIKMKREIKKS